jgi:hypothetical protein
MALGPTLLEEYAKEQMISVLIRGIFNMITLVTGAVLISMAYQSWEVGVGAACLVYFHKSSEK